MIPFQLETLRVLGSEKPARMNPTEFNAEQAGLYFWHRNLAIGTVVTGHKGPNRLTRTAVADNMLCLAYGPESKRAIRALPTSGSLSTDDPGGLPDGALPAPGFNREFIDHSCWQAAQGGGE